MKFGHHETQTPLLLSYSYILRGQVGCKTHFALGAEPRNREDHGQFGEDWVESMSSVIGLESDFEYKKLFNILDMILDLELSEGLCL